MEEKESVLDVVFSTNITEKDLMNFKLYHNYHSFSGIVNLVLGLIVLVICIVSFGRVNISYTLMTGFIGLFFTVYTPIGMKLKVRNQMKSVKAFCEPVVYTVTEDKIVLSQGDIKEELLWDDIFKIKFTGKNLILYITSVRANIIPLSDIGNQMEPFLKIADKKLKPFQIKVNRDKVVKLAQK